MRRLRPAPRLRDRFAARIAGGPLGSRGPAPLPGVAPSPDFGNRVEAAIGELTAGDEAGGATSATARSGQLARLGAALAGSARVAGAAAVVGGQWLVDVLLDVAPRIPVRDLATLQRHHPGLGADALGEVLIQSAARTSAAIGAASGALATVSWTAPPSLLVSGSVVIATETLAVACVETKLLAELHQVYDSAPGGSAGQRGLAYVWAWTNRRGIDPLDPASVPQVLAGSARRLIRNRLVGRAGRNVTSLGPVLTGAALGSATNYRETARLGRAVRDDLRRRA